MDMITALFRLIQSFNLASIPWDRSPIAK